MPQLGFHGAAGTVTGAMHLVHLGNGGGTVAMDCGLFQGPREAAREWNRSFPVPPAELRSVILSHAHIDHSGNIPGLVRQGFRGRIRATAATCDLAGVMLADSAKIQEEDAAYWNARRAAGPNDRIEPLYTLADARASAPLFDGVEYGRPVAADGCKFTFLDAGHILGSAAVLLEIGGPPPVRLLYTGDLGRFGVPILRDPTEPLPAADYLVTECTYAGQRHDEPAGMKERLVGLIRETSARGGKTIIPAFSVGRTQTLAYYLQQAVGEKLLGPVPIFVDSPLSASVTEVFRRHPECYDAEARAFWREEGDVFGREIIKYITSVDESKALNDRTAPCVIIASSGMCENGRILHHLKHAVEDERNLVIIVGYQAENTLGRRIAERRHELKIFGRMYNRRCRVEVLTGFSAHADSRDFQRLLGPLARGLKAAFVVHGEADQAAAMRKILARAGCPKVNVPAPGDRFDL